MYKIVRSYKDRHPNRRTIETGLTLEEVKAHCNDPETSSRTCTLPAKRRITTRNGEWFDGYEET